MNRDFAEMLSALSAEGAEFLVVGAYAMAAHGYPRATGDIDVWVRPSPENAERVLRALRTFGAPLFDLQVSDLVSVDTVFQIGLPPNRIDLLTGISGVAFDEAWPSRMRTTVDGIEVPVLGMAHLLQNKRASGRPKDQADLVWLESKAKPE
jgi:hypothetical protein